MAKNVRALSLRRLEKDSFVTETMVNLAGFGDFLLTAESNLQQCKESGFRAIARLYGPGGNIKSREAKCFLTAHRKRYDRDMARVLRYTAVMGLYILLETTARKFIADFGHIYPDKRRFCQGKHQGFVASFRQWLETPPNAIQLARPRIWSLLDDLGVIRNCIAHVNGDLTLETRPTQIERCTKTVRRTRKVRFDARGRLVLDAEFAFEVLERIEAFFRLLFREAGYRLAVPPGHAESFAKSFAGFEEEIGEGIEAYDARQTINLGGPL
jgi:hypothetical protein